MSFALGLATKRNLAGFQLWPLFFLAVSFALAGYIFYDGIYHMLLDWERDEYSHGYIIPLISLYILLQKIPSLSSVNFNRHQYVGVIMVMIGVAGYVLGELSALFNIIQYSLLLVIAGVVVSLLGTRGAMILIVPIAYLLFMIPLPNFLYLNLSSKLQLVSSWLGVSIVRLLGVSVFLEGNVIDLGVFRLQVVDACSGLRYLFPLMSFGFLVAYFYKAAMWKRLLIFLSTVPITIFMNSFRIAVIGLTVDIWGIAAAEGFLHDFEGWVVFMACLVLLAVEVWILEKISGKSKAGIFDKLDVSLPKKIIPEQGLQELKTIRFSALITLSILILAIPFKSILSERTDYIPPRTQFTSMPLVFGPWVGHEGRIDQEIFDVLKVSDYFIADFSNANTQARVNFYVAYYDSQRKGASVHSPKTCLPGGGWQIQDINQVELKGISSSNGKPLRVNRVIIQNKETKSLVYYWFQQRGRIITNEYLLKWYIFSDAIMRNRTDGSLVRYVVDISGDSDVDSVEKQLQDFVSKTVTLLPKYIPE